MGQNIEQVSFDQAQFNTFKQVIREQLDTLQEIVQQPNFGRGKLKFGAELEMYLIDDNGDISLSNQTLLEALDDPQYQPELNRYNLELNLAPVDLAGTPFSTLQRQMQDKTDHLERVAEQLNINVLPIGILPTLKKQHLNAEFMTDIPRYHCLSNYLYKARGDVFQININGDESLAIDLEDISAEGANTSFQVHLMIAPEQFTAVYNAAQLTLPLVTAISANSSVFLGKRLWDETRIALFKQSIDIRRPDSTPWQEQPRVNFGFGWLQGSAWQLFSQAVCLFEPVIPVIFDTKSETKLPPLKELSLHLGTTWPWHRPVYCNDGNGHIRLEFRAIPAGPTSIDMLANAAFAIGLATGVAKDIDAYTSVLPFQYAEYNFYRAAQSGLSAKVLWPLKHKYHVGEVNITEVIDKLLPIAKDGLLSLNISEQEADKFLTIIRQRLATGVTGAIWQKKTLEHLMKSQSSDDACHQLTQLYLSNCRTCQPVSQWEQIWQ
ncbi:hypothetical protein LP316_06605 [Thalassotalea sp. LPB0316]|uniref:hypothetical protein n=1 Tax=Thalassotalea sp. LPB0316 TaxID=2769490 RepID=UPI001865D7DF|nr:hypothetical protein [Thalassotalea sp. LPB0316]QOL26957.1 hypothetical protein LP316_06605 [Thalassotalea sp. LPB0316]